MLYTFRSQCPAAWLTCHTPLCQQEEHLKALDGQECAEGEGQGVKRARDDSLLPLVIPVSVPVRQTELELSSGPGHGQTSWSLPRPGQQDPAQAEHKASVIVTRRRSLRNSLSESSAQVGLALQHGNCVARLFPSSRQQRESGSSKMLDLVQRKTPLHKNIQ